jgi:hypothetical protein
MKKISLTILRVIYMFGFPVFAHFWGHLIETKIKLFFFAALIIFYLGTFLIKKYFNKNLLNYKALVMRVLIILFNLCLAPFIQISFVGILIYIFLFLITALTVTNNDDLIEMGEGLFLGIFSDFRFIVLILISLVLFFYKMFF